MKGATSDSAIKVLDEYISIHAPVKGATYGGYQLRVTERISIHAPVKGATTYRHLKYHSQTISIHAPVKGATGMPYRTLLATSDFNPRSREGSDPLFAFLSTGYEISIHAPVKGATKAYGVKPLIYIFQSTLP